jgi:hypothetical protein
MIARIGDARRRFRELHGRDAIRIGFTEKSLEALWVDICGGNAEMMKSPKFKNGEAVHSFTVHRQS